MGEVRNAGHPALVTICSSMGCCFLTSKFSDFLNAPDAKCQLARAAICSGAEHKVISLKYIALR